jgi:hypothetical protein
MRAACPKREDMLLHFNHAENPMGLAYAIVVACLGCEGGWRGGTVTGPPQGGYGRGGRMAIDRSRGEPGCGHRGQTTAHRLRCASPTVTGPTVKAIGRRAIA